MSTGIEWTDETWNPTTGCTKVSPGCDHCYAETITERFHGKGSFAEVKLHPDRLDKPLHWRKPRRVFVNSMSDLFHEDVPDEFIARVFAACGAAERHTFQILTKRHGRMRSLLSSPEFARQVKKFWWVRWYMLTDVPDNRLLRRKDDPPPVLRVDNRRARSLAWSPNRTSFPLASTDFPWPLPNVHLGVSVETQQWADIRIPALLGTPAAVRFLSCEPLLGPICLDPWHTPHDAGRAVCGGPPASLLHWVIVGGESGPHARPMDPEWARSLRDQCVDAGVPFLFKQWGGHTPKAGGRELDGRTWDEFPDLVPLTRRRP